MATNERLTQLSVEVLSSGTGDLRHTQLCVEVLSTTGDQPIRLTQLSVEILQQNDAVATLRVTQTGQESAQQPPASSLVTQTGSESGQARGQTLVSQTGMEASQQAGEVRVSQIGLEIGYTVPPRGVPGGLPCPEFLTTGADVVQACPVDFDPPLE